VRGPGVATPLAHPGPSRSCTLAASAGAGQLVRGVAKNKQPHNNALERTRRVGVPASRAVVGVPPCRSTQCSTDRVSILEACPALKLEGIVVSQRWGHCP